MIIRTEHKAIEDIMKTMNRDQEDYDKEIDNMLGQIERLREIWMGEDADIFCEKADEYIRNMKKITSTIKILSSQGTSTNQNFVDADQSFSKALEEEANKYEPSDYE